ncbi:MAG: MFS transporter [Proteobacteria bacterium]|nr:MFS transporter [Pseudomonadota bacterium]
MKILLLFIFWNLWFLNFSSRTVFSPLLPIIEEELRLTHAMAGSIFIFSSVGYTATLVLAGFLSPRFGHKRIVVAGFLVVSIAYLFMRDAQSYWSLALSVLLIGVGSGIYIPSIIPIITAIFHPQRWGKAIAFHDTGASFNIFAVPILVALSLRFFHWRTLFLILSSACLAGVFFFWLFSPDPRTHEEQGFRFRDIIWRRDFWIMAMFWISAASATIGVYSIIPLFLVDERGMTLELANTIFGASRFGGIFVTLLAGILADRYGTKRILFLTFLLTGISTIGLALARHFPFLVTMLVLQASLPLAFFPVGLLSIAKLTTFKERSVFTGASMALGVIVGIGLTPFGLGAVADAWSFEIGILALGILTVLPTLFLRRLKGI